MRQIFTTVLLLCASATAQGTTSLHASPGGGFTIDAGDAFGVRIFNPLQMVWTYDHRDGTADRNDFSLRRARTQFDGHVHGRDKTFRLMLEWAAAPTLLETWFRWQFWQGATDDDAVSLRVGRQRPHHGREFAAAVFMLEHIDRSLSSRTFSGRRVDGAWLLGSHLEGGRLHWALGAGNGDAGASTVVEAGNGASNPDNELTYYADVHFDPLGNFGDEDFELGVVNNAEGARGTIGAALMIGNHRGTGALAGTDIETTSINLYTHWRRGSLHAFGEVFLRSDDPQGPGGQETDHTGWTLSAGYVLPPSHEGGGQWGLAARVGMVTADDDTSAGPPARQNNVITPLVDGGGALRQGDVTDLEATLTRYLHGHRMRAQLAYRHRIIDFDNSALADRDDDTVELQFQWMF